MKNSKNLKLLIGVLISAVAVWFAVQGINFNQVGDSLGRLNYGLVLLSFIPYGIALIMKVTRWQLLFYPGPKITLGRLWSTLMMSYLFNTVLPARLGEVVRAYALSRSENIGPVRVLSTILLEKILDVMTMFIFLVALLPFLDISSDFRNAAFFTGGLVVSAFVVCLLMAAFRKQAEILIKWFLKFLPTKIADKLYGFVSEILDVLGVLLNFKLSLNLWAQSIFQWTLVIANYMILGWALGIPLTFELAMLLMITLNLGMAVPSAPGYIGVFEALVKAALTPFFPGQDSLLLTFGLLLHVLGFLPVIIFGAIASAREGVTLGKIPTIPPDRLTPSDIKAN